MMAMNTGMTVMICMIVPMNRRKVLSHTWRLTGSLLSQMSTSFPNLLTILPRGVVSKKDIGLIITLVSIFLWSRLEAFRVENAMMAE